MTSLRPRLDSLDDRQLRLLVHFLDGAAQGETREQRWLRERLREGIDWLEHVRSEGHKIADYVKKERG